MSFGRQGPAYSQPFSQRLNYEDHIHNQIETCRKAFNLGDKTEVMYAVQGLLSLVTPRLSDQVFLEKMEKLDDDWRAERGRREAERAKEISEVVYGCVDVMEQIQKEPGIAHFRKQYMAALALFERKGLMLKLDNDETI